jgi:predicted transposase/invertase (TIGR01784 family)
MAQPLLRPTLDVVFKLLFARNERLLCGLVGAVLGRTVTGAEVLNPELDTELPSDRAVFLDVRAVLDDGTNLCVEMQCDPRGALPERWVYEWARLFGDVLRRGDEFDDYAPVVSVVFLDFEQTRVFHRHYAIRDPAGAPLTDAFELHIVELPVHDADTQSGPESALARWCRFLRARPDELDSLAAEDPIMAEAKRALELLSEDEKARQAAITRDFAFVGARLIAAAERRQRKAMLAQGLAEGREQGRAEGRAEGRAVGLRAAIATAARAVGLALDASTAEWLEGLDEPALELVLRGVITDRAFPAH